MIELIESFDSYSNQYDVGLRWNRASLFGIAAGRFGGGALWLNQSGIGLGINPWISLPAGSLATRTIGFAFIQNSEPSSGPLCTLYDGATAQFSICYNAFGQSIYVAQGSGFETTILGACNQLYAFNRWVYVEAQFTIGSSGSITIRTTPGTGTTPVLSLTGVNLQQSSSASANVLGFGGINQTFIDDFYVVNGSGGGATSFLGESRIITALPNADGSNATWTPSSGTSHYACVDTTNPSGSSTYLSTSTAGNVETLQFPAITVNGTIATVQTSLCLAKSDTGSRTVAAEFRSNAGTNYTSGTTFSPGASFAISASIAETNPATGAAWVNADLTGAQFGLKLVS